MVTRISKLVAFGALFVVLVGLTMSEPVEVGEDIEYVTLEDIDAMIEMMDFENLLSGRGGLRKLQDDTCWHGGQCNQILTMAVRSAHCIYEYIQSNII